VPIIDIVNTPMSVLDEETQAVVNVAELKVINDVDYALVVGCTVIV
jgi:hypothetical protein